MPDVSLPYHPIEIESLEVRRFLASDLVATVELAPTIANGAVIRPLVTVFNAGDDAVRAIWTMRFVLSPDPIAGNGNDLTIGSETRSLIPAEGSITTRPALMLPFAPANGSYFLGVVLDTTSAVPESVETNNAAFTATPVVWAFNGSGVLPISGTDGVDHIVVRESGTTVQVDVNGVRAGNVFGGNLSGIRIATFGGNDVIELFTTSGATIDAGDGNDHVVSGAGDDVIDGGAGFDRLFGRDGDDHLIGGGGADRLYGDAGNDTCSGHGGHDILMGGDGNDWLIGGPGNDYFYADDQRADTIIGNAGDDLAEADLFDELVNVSPIA